MRFKNKVVIVTGASSGIGAATALLVAKEGGDVVVVGRNEEKLKKVEETANYNGNKVFVIKADVSKEAGAKQIITETIDKFGKLDVLVNNAGIVRFASILDGKLFDNFDEIMNTNLRGVAYLTMLAAPHLLKTKGNIVNVSSVAGKSFKFEGSKTLLTYCTSKAALDHFFRGSAVELGEHGVRVNIVSPGPVFTDIFVNAGLKNDIIKDAAVNTLLNRVSTADEVAKLIAFVASDDAVGITGSDFIIDNGVLIQGNNPLSAAKIKI